MKIALEHRTTYRFDRPIAIGPHVIRLRPAPHSRTPIEAYSLTISPTDHFINWQQDPFGNYLARAVFPTKASELDITVGLVADMKVINPFDFFIESYAETYPFDYPDELAADLKPYLDLSASGLGPLVGDWVAASAHASTRRTVHGRILERTERRHLSRYRLFGPYGARGSESRRHPHAANRFLP